MVGHSFNPKQDKASGLKRSNSPVDPICQEPLKESYTVLVAQKRLKRIFNHYLGALNQICREHQYTPKLMRRINSEYHHYIDFYGSISAKGKIPFLPLLDMEDVGRIESYALHQKPFMEFLEFLGDYRARCLPPNADVDPDKMRQMARLYHEMAEIDRVTNRFRKVFEHKKKHTILLGSSEHKTVMTWVNWLLNVYPGEREPAIISEMIRFEEDRKRAVQNEAIHYSDPRKEGLNMLLLKIRRMLLKVQELQSIETDAKALIDSLASMERMERDGERRRRLHSIIGDIREKAFGYDHGTEESLRIGRMLEDSQDFLLELWPKD